MKVSFFIDRPIFSMVISILIVIVGFIGLTMLPIDQYPQITPPVVKITASYPGASALTVAKPRARRGESRIIIVIWTPIHSIGDLLGFRVSQSHIRKHSTKANLPQGSCERFRLASRHPNRFYTFHAELI